MAAAKTAKFSKEDADYQLMILGLGLAGEAGEAADKIKKLVDYEKGSTEELRSALVTELGDVLWYISQLAARFGSSLEEVAQKNIAKLADRAERGVVTKGAGDNR